MSSTILLMILLFFVVLGSITLARYRSKQPADFRFILLIIFIVTILLFLAWLAVMVFVVGPSM
jgi:hypothetical protein